MNDRTVVVTGGASGVGRGVAGGFAREGANVVVGDRDADALEETVAALEDAGGQVAGVRTDVRDEFDLERLSETASRFGDRGGIDVVVPAASEYHGAVGETPLASDSYAAFDDHWRTNARGVFATITEALPHLNEGARVLVPTGDVVTEGTAGYGSYAVSKVGAMAVARGFSADTDHVVACLDVGPNGGATVGPESDDVGELFVRAARDADPDALDGVVLDGTALGGTEDAT